MALRAGIQSMTEARCRGKCMSEVLDTWKIPGSRGKQSTCPGQLALEGGYRWSEVNRHLCRCWVLMGRRYDGTKEIPIVLREVHRKTCEEEAGWLGLKSRFPGYP